MAAGDDCACTNCVALGGGAPSAVLEVARGVLLPFALAVRCLLAAECGEDLAAAWVAKRGDATFESPSASAEDAGESKRSLRPVF